MGTPDFSVPALDALHAAGHEIAAVYTQPPRPAGRGQKKRDSPVALRAATLGLDIRHPVSLAGAEAQEGFERLAAEVAVVVAYGLILPRPVLDAPARGCLNIHASLLPRWRGAAPIHRAVMAGDASTGISIMQMDAGLDTGPVLLSKTTDIGAADTAGDLHDRLAGIGAELISDALSRLPSLVAMPQQQDGVSYAAKIDKAEAGVDWTRSAEEIDRKIRGLSPFPGAWTTLEGKRIKLLRSALAEGSARPGTVLRGLTVACGTGAVEVLEVQAAGRERQEAAAFLRGRAIAPGNILGG